MLEYIRDGQEIYRQSFAPIRAEAALSKIPADLEILESFSVKVDESILTGESVSVDKGAGENQGLC